MAGRRPIAWCTSPVRDGVPRLALSEAELVGLARALIAGHPAEVRMRLFRQAPLPPAISTACAQVLGDTLALAWPALWRRGGTRPAASVDAGGVLRRGRLWERHAPIGLTFSAATLQLLRWLLTGPTGPTGRVGPGAAPAPWLGALTVGDQVMMYLALDATAGMPAQAVIASHAEVRAAPLAWLGFAELLGGGPPRDYDSVCQGAGALVVEALAGELAVRWRRVELGKRAMTSPGALIGLGAVQDAVLEAFMAACDRHGRRDLAGFVIDAAAPLLARGIAPVPAELDATATLANRARARVAAGALLRGVVRWAAWDEAHRGVRFLDDEYAATQLVLARFEAIQATGAARAAAWLADLASLAPTTAAASAATVGGP
jgi:FtsH ternary system-associated peptide